MKRLVKYIPILVYPIFWTSSFGLIADRRISAIAGGMGCILMSIYHFFNGNKRLVIWELGTGVVFLSTLFFMG